MEVEAIQTLRGSQTLLHMRDLDEDCSLLGPHSMHSRSPAHYCSWAGWLHGREVALVLCGEAHEATAAQKNIAKAKLGHAMSPPAGGCPDRMQST